MAFSDSYILANNPIFKEKVIVAIAKVAIQVGGEVVEVVGGVPRLIKHEKRARLSVKVLGDPNLMLMPFSYAIVSGGILTAASSDADIEFTVISVFDDIAGVIITD